MSDTMSDTDRFPNLSQVIDVGGDRYIMGPQKPIELGFKSRKNYLDSFGTDRRTEYLLRKYLFLSLKDKGRRLTFDSTEDKADLIAILKKRAAQLQRSSEFTSSTLKNTLIQKSYLNIQRLIQELEGPEYKPGADLLKMPDISLPCTRAKKYIRQIPEDQLFELVLEMAWYLLHPDKVPSSVECDWAKLVKQLDTFRLGDIMTEIRRAEEERGDKPAESAFNYFKKVNLGKVAKADKIENALDQAKRLALEVKGETVNDQMKDRIKTLLEVLKMKKYLSNDIPFDPDRMNVITSDIQRSMIKNPMRGGALEKPLGVAMRQMFDYFRAIFDPVYSFIESGLATYYKGLCTGSLRTVVIPQLTTLLHICNNLNPAESTVGGQNTFGVYRIRNVDAEVVGFLQSMLKTTETHLSTFKDDSERNTFSQEIFQLPKVRLTSLVNKFADAKVYKDPDTLPCIQFLVIGGNMSLALPKGSSSAGNDEMVAAIKEFFVEGDVYIQCTKSDNISENIPMNLYEVDFGLVDVADTGLKISNLPDNYFNKLRDSADVPYLEKLVTLAPYVVFNDAELALSIFAAFKDLMPN